MPRSTTDMRLLGPVLLALAGLFSIETVHAECGGSVDCIAASIDGSPPAHGTPRTSAPLEFGTLGVGTVSAPQTIAVGAVGGATGQATISALGLRGPDAGEFNLTTDCTVGVPSLTHGGASCTITVTFSPASEGAKTAAVEVTTSAITRTVPLSGGQLEIADDPITRSLLRAQIDTAKRFSRAQIGNVRRRLDTMRAVRHEDLRPPPEASAMRTPNSAGDTPVRAEKETLVAEVLARLASERSLDVGRLSAVGGEEGGAASSSWWVGGDIHFGTRDASSDGSSQTFSSEGLTIGYDRWLADNLAIGVGVGFAQGDTDVGTEGSEDSASSTSIVGYINYAPAPSVYLDAMLGYGTLSYDTERYDVASDDIADSSRDGSLWFTSLGAGYLWRHQELTISPFARLEFTALDLDSETESGSLNNLRYRSQSVDTSQLVVGVLAQAPHETSFGWALPRMRLEIHSEDEGDADADLGIPGGPVTSVVPSDSPDETLVFGLGTELFYRNGMQLVLEYQGLHSSGEYDSQVFAVGLTGDLDGKPASWMVPVRLVRDPVRVETGYFVFDNLNRARDSVDEVSDEGFDVSARKALTFPASATSQFVLSGDLSGTNMREHDGLDRVSAAVQGEFQYRTSSSFGAPTFGAVARASLDGYESSLRSGSMYEIGLNAHKRITDRISLFGALEQRGRSADSEVFDTEDAGLRVALDYMLTDNDLLLLSGEFRDGDTVSSVASRAGADFFSPIADAREPDDAYHEEDFIAYRFEAETQLWTLGYNRALGPQDSLDIALQYIESDPDESPAGGSSSYTSERVSVYYLTRF